jgi:4-amino-4-deoxy-L-arabinose transferase-like glycosyltransferase
LEVEELFGIPAHPLMVHAAVVLLPLAALLTLVCAVVPRTRRHYAPLAFALALAATVAVGLAQGSGEALEDRVDETELVEEHTGQGERVLPWALGVVVVAGAVVALPRLSSRRPALSGTPVRAAVVAVALIAGAGAVWMVVEVGHSGAKATWEDIGDDRSGRDDGGR